MAYNLQTVFTVRDNASNKIKQLTKHVEQLNKALKQVSTQFNQLNGAVNGSTNTIVHNTTVINNNSNTINNNTNTINRNTNVRNTMINAIGRESNALRGLGASLVSVAGLYAAAHGASKAFNATIGAAAEYQQSEVAVKAIFNDDEASKAYLKMVDKMAIDSPLLNSGEMLKSSKTLTAMTKNVDDLGKAWSIIERLMVLDPTQGTEGAAFALKEMWQGDALSMVERFGLSKKDLNRIKKLDIPEQISEINKLLDGMGITQNTVNAMGQTTLGYWAQIQERADKFLRIVGASGNTKLGKVLGDIVATLDNVDLDSMAKRFGDALGTVVDKAIDVGKFLWKWREPLAWAVGAIAAASAAFVGIGVISALASPISLIAAGIGGAAVGMKALYDNSETFRGIVDGIIGKVKELWGAFKSGGVNGLLDAILPKDVSTQIQNVIGDVQSKIGALSNAFQQGGIGGVVDMLFGNGTSENIKAKFDEIKTYVTDKITELQPTFERLKGIFTVVWDTISSVFDTVWNGILKPGFENFWNALQILGDVATLVFNNVIVPGLEFASSLFSVLWSVAGPILKLLGAALNAAFDVLKWVWDNILAPLVEFILGGVKNAFEAFTDAVNVVGGAFDWIGGIIDSVADKISDFVSAIKNVKLPDWVTKGVSATVKWVGNAIGATPDGSHYHGLTSVPYNNYLASLHKGEMVLTRQEADAYRSSAMNSATVDDVSYRQVADSISYNKVYNTENTSNHFSSSNSNSGSTQGGGVIVQISGNEFTVREESDIEKLAYDLAKYIEKEALQIG